MAIGVAIVLLALALQQAVRGVVNAIGTASIFIGVVMFLVCFLVALLISTRFLLRALDDLAVAHEGAYVQEDSLIEERAEASP